MSIMNSAPDPSTEKPAHIANAWSATCHFKLLIKSLRRTANNFSMLQPKKKIDDEEHQPNTIAEDISGELSDDASVFKASSRDGTKVRTLEGCPNGYPRLAAFNASEQNFMLYRSFSCVHARLLLNLQTSIQMLESELDGLDRFHDTLEDKKIRLKSWDLDVGACEDERKQGARTRDDILEELRVKVCQYDELLIKTKELVAFQRPSNRDYRSVRHWFHNVAPLVGEEQDYILWKEDIITLRHGREWAGFDGLVEELLHMVNCRLVRWIFCTDELRRKTSDERVYYFSPTRVSKLVNLAITSVIFTLIVAPVLSMYYLSTLKSNKAILAAIGVLMVFTLLFAAAISLLTKARRHELFAATAAYCAVLVVFVGSSNFN